jgi:2',3'-cyclic-nucleotide 2'-phosphodiesterase (5'-nucleotidase family)
VARISTAGVAPDPAIAALVKQYEDKLDENLKVAVGTTAVELDSRRATVRLKEAVIGNLIADAIRESTKADVAITNGGGIRGDRTYAAGTTLTRKDVLTELPFGNVTVTMDITGADLRAALEEGVSLVEDVAGRFRTSRASLVFDARRPRGSRVLDVKVGTLDPAATYRLATNEYMMAGGDGYASLTKGSRSSTRAAAPSWPRSSWTTSRRAARCHRFSRDASSSRSDPDTARRACRARRRR